MFLAFVPGCRVPTAGLKLSLCTLVGRRATAGVKHRVGQRDILGDCRAHPMMAIGPTELSVQFVPVIQNMCYISPERQQMPAHKRSAAGRKNRGKIFLFGFGVTH